MAIISSGIGSGLDINSLVTQLVEAQRAPQQQRLDVREARLQARLSGYGTLQSALSSLQQSLIPLRAQTAFETRGVSVGNADVLSAVAGSGVAGSHQVKVDALATAQRIVSDSALEQARFTSPGDVLGTGTLTFSFGTTTLNEDGYAFSADAARKTHSVTITDGSLNGIRDAINQANIGVQASLVYDGTHYRLALAASETGAANSMQITAQDADGNDSDAAGLSLLAFNADARHMQQTQAAGDTAGLVIDGIAISSASNVLSGIVSGVDITLRAPGESSITLTPDDKAAIDAVANFVDKYNALIGAMNSLSSFDVETGIAGQLNGDHVLRSVESQLRRALNQMSFDGGAGFRHLAEIGITHSVEDGTMVLDRERLQQVLTEDRAGVVTLFAGSPAEDGGRIGGIAAGLDRTLSALLSRDGIFTAATESLNVNIRDIARQRELLELRTLAFEERTRTQFSLMDALVGQLRSTSDFLMQQIDNLPTIGRSNN